MAIQSTVSLLQHIDFCEQFKFELHDLIKINSSSVEEVRIILDTIKGLIRNKVIYLKLRQIQIRVLTETEFSMHENPFNQYYYGSHPSHFLSNK